MPLMILLLPACATVPDQGRAPTLARAQTFAVDRSSAKGAGAAEQWPAAEWWRSYGDRQLDAIMAEALAGSPDLTVATARVRQADAFAQQAGAERLPMLDVPGNVAATKQSYNNRIPAAFVPKGWNDTGRLEADLGFDLDLWGRNKASYAAARSDAEAARLDLAQSALTLSSNIAEAYADLARLFAVRSVQVAVLDIRQQTQSLTSDRVASGLDTQANLRLVQGAVPAARADIVATDEQMALTRNRLAALMGKGPDRGLDIVAPTATMTSRGLPADATTALIGRRPYIVAARTRVEAEASRIKVARADFYPAAVNVSAAFGLQSFGLDDLLMSGSKFGSAGPAFTLPIFHGGELQGRYRSARAKYDEAVASYDGAVTSAYRAVADAVVSQRALAAQLTEQRQSLADAQAAYGIARQRHEGGLSRFLDVLTAQDRALQTQRIVAELEARAFTLDVSLVRALGGGSPPPSRLPLSRPARARPMADADPTPRQFDQAHNPEALAGANSAASTKRKTLLGGIAAVVLLGGVGYGGWYALVGSHYVETDNAYVSAETAQVTPMVSGQAVAVLKTDTDAVRRGDVFIWLDDSDAQIALATAEADLAKARRQFDQSSATSTALSAQVQARGADILSARAQLVSAQAAYDKARIDFDRRNKLVSHGAVSGDELTSATNALAAARASLEQARAAVAQASSQRGAAAGNLAANDALIRGTTVTSAPDVLASEARVRQARLDLARTVVRAPIDGVIANRTIHVGQRVAPGATVMRIMPVSQVYVDANFKEGQPEKVKPGQPVTLTSDLYGGGVEYHGSVDGFSGGTGSSFALIPAQNATGNWIKVVQRLPVGVTLDPRELAAHPLRVGLSMTAEIDTSAR